MKPVLIAEKTMADRGRDPHRIAETIQTVLGIRITGDRQEGYVNTSVDDDGLLVQVYEWQPDNAPEPPPAPASIPDGPPPRQGLCRFERVRAK